jgi:hypothetical protein
VMQQLVNVRVLICAHNVGGVCGRDLRCMLVR